MASFQRIRPADKPLTLAGSWSNFVAMVAIADERGEGGRIIREYAAALGIPVAEVVSRMHTFILADMPTVH
jgi:hypothetical protein